MKKILGICLIAIFLTGCSAIRRNRNLDFPDKDPKHCTKTEEYGRICANLSNQFLFDYDMLFLGPMFVPVFPIFYANPNEIEFRTTYSIISSEKFLTTEYLEKFKMTFLFKGRTFTSEKIDVMKSVTSTHPYSYQLTFNFNEKDTYIRSKEDIEGIVRVTFPNGKQIEDKFIIKTKLDYIPFFWD